MDSAVLGCHREMVGREMECVDERSVEDRIQTTASANDT